MGVTVGLDEVGRGCWAGPLVVAAVALSKPISGLKDSKLLSRKQRQVLVEVIREEALCIGIGWVDAAEVDGVGLAAALNIAFKNAFSQIDINYDRVVIDGSVNYLVADPKTVAITKADMTVPAVSAASIVAKVMRDDYMHKMSRLYPNYQFDKHVGYGTKLHIEMLQAHGVCMLHRKSYKPIKRIMAMA